VKGVTTMENNEVEVMKPVDEEHIREEVYEEV
jgi:hypothetical protein